MKHLHEVAKSTWAGGDKKKALCAFAMGKVSQRQGSHLEAIDHFSRAIEFDRSQAHAYFRRAWSHKAQGDYLQAGEDFEAARRLRFDDPNFTVDYRSIGHCEYMELESEPDFNAPFPSLLPSPGFNDIF
jgi:tetratricopeptide (TPR) repeat protein